MDKLNEVKIVMGQHPIATAIVGFILGAIFF